MSKPPVRARDLRSAIKEQGFERGVVTTLEQMLDEHAEMKQHIRELAELTTLCINQVEQMIRINSGMQGIDGSDATRS